MKNLFKSMIIIAAAAMTFSACNKTIVEPSQNEEDFYYTFALTSPETRALLASDAKGKFGQWENGDRLGTAIDDAAPGYAYVTTSTTPVTFRIYKKGGLAEGETVYAYYPYNSSAVSVSEIPMSIPAGQNQDESTFDFDAMPMVANGFVVPASYASGNNNTEVGEISLVNLGSVIDFQVFSTNATYAEETILNVKFSASGAIAGDFTKDITAVNTSDENTLAISGFTGTDITTTVANAPAIGASRDEAAHVYMVVAPASSITGTVIVTTNKAVYTYSMATAQTFKRAGLKSFGLNLGTCQNRVAEEMNTTTFVFNTTAGIEALGLELPAASAGTNVERVVSDCIVLEGDVAEGSTQPRVWNSSGTYNFRVNKNNTITFSVSEGTIKGISFEAGSNFNLTVSEGTLTGTNWEGSASSVTFTNTDANRTDINTITVSYIGGVAPVEPIKLVMSDITCDDPEENENSLTFSWTAVDNADGYQVSTDGGNTYGEAQSELTYNWTGLAAGRQYTIYVKAVGDGTNYLTSEAKSQTGKTKASEGGGTPTDFSEDFANVTIGGASVYSAATWSHNASGTSWSATYSSTEIATLSTNNLNVAIGKTPGNVSFSGDNGITKLSFDYKSQGNATTMKITIKSGDNTVYEETTSLSKNSTGSVSLTASDFSAACEGAFSVTIANTSEKNSLQISAVNWTSAK